MANILVTGGSGQIGSRLVERLSEMFSPSDKIYLLKRKNPIANVDPEVKSSEIQESDLNSHTYDFAFHLAANVHTKFNQDIEKIPDFYKDNVKLTEAVVSRSGRVLITSSDNVFRGKSHWLRYTESAEPNPNPRNTYGITKAIAEEIVLDKNGSIIRLQTMLGVKSNLIMNRVFDAIDGKPYWAFWNNTAVRPSYFEDLLKTAKAIYNGDKAGVYHVSCNGEPLSRAEIASKILAIFKYQGRDIALQEEKFNEENCNDKHFPRYLILDTQETQQELGINFTSIDQALKAHVIYARKNIN